MQEEVNAFNIYEDVLEKCIEDLEKLARKQLKKEKYKDKILSNIVDKVKRNARIITERNKEYLSQLKKHLKNQDKSVISVIVETETRCLVDTSSPFAWLVDEIGLAWDPILDTPYIPATEIKGTVSAVLEFEDKALRNLLLGSTEKPLHKSLVDFTDAYPIEASNGTLLERDVITPIYGSKIEEHEASPTPVHFITIAPGVKFEFLIIIDKPRLNLLIRNYRENRLRGEEKELVESIKNKLDAVRIDLNEFLEKIKEKVLKSVEKAFKVWGIGAKTSSGYGIFKLLSSGDWDEENHEN